MFFFLVDSTFHVNVLKMKKNCGASDVVVVEVVVTMMNRRRVRSSLHLEDIHHLNNVSVVVQVCDNTKAVCYDLVVECQNADTGSLVHSHSVEGDE
jgi:hypothetical protein